MKDAVSTPKMTANFYETARRYIPDDRNFHTRHHENMKPHVTDCHNYYR